MPDSKKNNLYLISLESKDINENKSDLILKLISAILKENQPILRKKLETGPLVLKRNCPLNTTKKIFEYFYNKGATLNISPEFIYTEKRPQHGTDLNPDKTPPQNIDKKSIFFQVMDFIYLTSIIFSLTLPHKKTCFLAFSVLSAILAAAIAIYIYKKDSRLLFNKPKYFTNSILFPWNSLLTLTRSTQIKYFYYDLYLKSKILLFVKYWKLRKIAKNTLYSFSKKSIEYKTIFKNTNSKQKLIIKMILSILIIAITLISNSKYQDIIENYNYKVDSYISSTTKTMLKSYATAKGLIAIISLAKSIQLSIPLIGGISVKPGEVLEPIQDLAEKASSIFLISITAVGFEKIIFEVSKAIRTEVLISLLALVATLTVWGQNRIISKTILKKILILAFIIKLFVPSIILADDIVGNIYLYKERDRIDIALSNNYSAIQRDSSSLIAQIKAAVPATTDHSILGLNIPTIDFNSLKESINELKDQSDNLLKDIISLTDNLQQGICILMSIYVFQSIITPVFSFYLLVKLINTLLNINMSLNFIHKRHWKSDAGITKSRIN